MSEFDRWRVFLRGLQVSAPCKCVTVARGSFGSRQIKRIYHHLQAGASRVTCLNVVFTPGGSHWSEADWVRRTSLFFLLVSCRPGHVQMFLRPCDVWQITWKKTSCSLKDDAQSSDYCSPCVSTPCTPLKKCLVWLQANGLLSIGTSLYYFLTLGEIKIDCPISSPTWSCFFFFALISLPVVERW